MYPIYGMKDAKLDEVEMHQVLQNIPKKYAEVLILYYVNGYKSREIAKLFEHYGKQRNTTLIPS